MDGPRAVTAIGTTGVAGIILVASWQAEGTKARLLDLVEPGSLRAGFWAASLCFLPEQGTTLASLSDEQLPQADPTWFGLREQVRRARKVYTVDNGLTRALTTKVSQDRGALIENLVFQELRRRGVDAYCLTQPDYEVDFLVREDRRVTQLIQVCAGLDKPETVTREYGALYKAGKATHCKELVLLTPNGAAPSEAWVPSGPAVRVEAIWKWVLET